MIILEACGIRKTSDPSDDQVRAVLCDLRVRDGDAFAILGATGDTYIQCSGDVYHGFDLEYQEGTEVTEKYKSLHMRCFL